ncbi:MAG: hypothetical protein J1F10_06740 [Muribaculaceae bacterium]|nr:hypothetical protein [Muribaculaceae bacterium]
MSSKKYPLRAIASFLLVLFTMPLGHALMILMEHFLQPGALHISAFIMGLVGLLITIVGVFINGDLRQTLCGLFGGLLFWTGWVEFLFQYYADRCGMEPFVDSVTGKITQPEYMIMPATFGFLVMFLLLYMFSIRSGCNFFNWCQKKCFGNRRDIIVARPITRHVSIVTFMQLNVMMWTCYVVLMFCYDTQFLGDTHPITLLLALTCLIGSMFIFLKQIRISSWGANIRMAIATVIVFWTFVEILGHIGILKEIWIEPLEHIWTMIGIVTLFLILGGYTIYQALKKE